jgi:hypothetical protein
MPKLVREGVASTISWSIAIDKEKHWQAVNALTHGVKQVRTKVNWHDDSAGSFYRVNEVLNGPVRQHPMFTDSLRDTLDGESATADLRNIIPVNLRDKPIASVVFRAQEY